MTHTLSVTGLETLPSLWHLSMKVMLFNTSFYSLQPVALANQPWQYSSSKITLSTSTIQPLKTLIENKSSSMARLVFWTFWTRPDRLILGERAEDCYLLLLFTHRKSIRPCVISTWGQAKGFFWCLRSTMPSPLKILAPTGLTISMRSLLLGHWPVFPLQRANKTRQRRRKRPHGAGGEQVRLAHSERRHESSQRNCQQLRHAFHWNVCQDENGRRWCLLQSRERNPQTGKTRSIRVTNREWSMFCCPDAMNAQVSLQNLVIIHHFPPFFFLFLAFERPKDSKEEKMPDHVDATPLFLFFTWCLSKTVRPAFFRLYREQENE